VVLLHAVRVHTHALALVLPLLLYGCDMQACGRNNGDGALPCLALCGVYSVCYVYDGLYDARFSCRVAQSYLH